MVGIIEFFVRFCNLFKTKTLPVYNKIIFTQNIVIYQT
jgi:hypothetical protein